MVLKKVTGNKKFMKQLQLIFDEVVAKQVELKEIKRLFRSELEQSAEYQKLSDEMKCVREDMALIKMHILERMKCVREDMALIKMHILERLGKKAEEMEEITECIKSKKQMMSDVALANLTKGESISVKDSNGIEYEPVFSVKFKRIY